ncbi:MAG: serine/threonine-protein phosphatase [Polyangiaceae bacterium]|nr:serine/threonine-protein phosphatase [Polyangiaceae bacterium]
MTREVESVLLRQLRRAGIHDFAEPPTPEAFLKLIDLVSDHYRRVSEDRALLMRSMELSTSEMDLLRTRVESQRDALRQMLLAVGEALGVFGSAVQDGLVSNGTDELTTVSIRGVKHEFSSRLGDLFREHDESSAEITGIRTNLVRLADQLITLLTSTAERAELRKELEVARAVQQLLVPGADHHLTDVFAWASYFKPASECGGDWWSTYELGRGRVLVVIGDVTGHGVASAIMTGVAKGCCDAVCRMHPNVEPADVLRLMSSVIYETALGQVMMTCTVALFDAATRTMWLANAGHHFPLLVRAAEAKPLVVQGPPLGAVADARYETIAVPFAPGDSFVWFTDGLIESENDGNEQFGERRLRAICQRTATAGAEGIRNAVVNGLRAFLGERPQADDVTLVVATTK